MRTLLLTVMAAGCLVVAPRLATAADIEALQRGNGECGAEATCFVSDNNWNVVPFTTTTQVQDTVTGSGLYVGLGGLPLGSILTGSGGSASVYLTEADGTTVTAISLSPIARRLASRPPRRPGGRMAATPAASARCRSARSRSSRPAASRTSRASLRRPAAQAHSRPISPSRSRPTCRFRNRQASSC